MTLRIRSTQWFIRNVFVANRSTKAHRKIHTSQRLLCTTVLKDNIHKSTVDQSDVDRHSKLMKDWWDLNGPMKALHTYNLIRVPFIRDGLMSAEAKPGQIEPLKNKTILDVGCGGGILSEPLARLGAQVTGLDASRELIECAREHSQANPKLANNQPNYVCTSIEEYAPGKENSFDGVVASEIIEHVNNKELFVQSCVKVLKPGGKIFITTPNKTKLAEFGVIFLAENIFNLVPKGTHQIEKFITPTDLTLLLDRNNCHVEIIYGIMYNFLTGRWSWSNYQFFAYALQARKLKSVGGVLITMSLTKLLTIPIKIFQKDVINFLVIRRHDLGSKEDQFRYIAVKPTASVSTLRQKMWHLLDLPDYCEEVIILKTSDQAEIPLTELRKGNEPQRPFILEVWLPARTRQSTSSTASAVNNNIMLTMGREDTDPTPVRKVSTEVLIDKPDGVTNSLDNGRESLTTITTETMVFNKFKNFIPVDHKKPYPRISNTSFFVKTQNKKNVDNYTTILLKIQSDLAILSSKLSVLENRIPS